jgi:hypothetical protein
MEWPTKHPSLGLQLALPSLGERTLAVDLGPGHDLPVYFEDPVEITLNQVNG